MLELNHPPAGNPILNHIITLNLITTPITTHIHTTTTTTTVVIIVITAIITPLITAITAIGGNSPVTMSFNDRSII